MLKKLLLILAFSLPLFAQHITGTGTVSDPYMLYNAADVDSLRYYSSDANLHFKLANDISLGSYSSWLPILPGFAWRNTLDGNGHKLTNLKLNTWALSGADYSMGLFWGLGGNDEAGNYPTIKNLVIDTVTISYNSTIVAGYTYRAGTLCGLLGLGQTNTNELDSVVITNLSISITTTSGTAHGFMVGGVVGTNDATINKVKTSGSIFVNISATPTTSLLRGVGGIAGSMSSITQIIQNSYSSCRVQSGVSLSTSGNLPSGGLVGYSGGKINDSYYKGGTVAGTYYVGGIIGVAAGLSAGGTTDRVYAVADSISCMDRVSGVVAGIITGHTGSISSDYNYSYADTQSCYINPVLTSADKTYGAFVDGFINDLPIPRTTAAMKLQSTYNTFNFSSIWSIYTIINNGYPYLKSFFADTIQIVLNSPLAGDAYTLADTVSISWASIYIDTLDIYYTNDNEFSWHLITSASGVSSSYKWYFPHSGTYKIKLVDKVTSYTRISGEFTILADYIINILSPIDSALNYTVGDSINIKIATTNIGSLNLFYATGDTVNWTLITSNITGINAIDTTIYNWKIPGIHGTIWLKASNIIDTATTFNKQVIGIGGGLPSYPAICWYSGSYYSSSWLWPSWAVSPYAYCGVVDPTCGWGYYSAYRFSIIINDYATGYDFFQDSVYTGTTAGSVANGPYNPYPKYFTYTLTDSTAHDIGELFSVGDSITYKNRLYFVNANDSTLRMNDLVHHINSIFVADLKDTYKNYWYAGTPMIQNYNIQPSKLYNKYFPSYLNLETLNSPYFEPVILLSSSNKNTHRGNYTVKVVALSAPSPEPYTQDIVNTFTTLNATRDYFRGIDPKARRHGR